MEDKDSLELLNDHQLKESNLIEKKIYLRQNKIRKIRKEINTDNKETGQEIIIDIEIIIDKLTIIIIDKETIIIKMIEILIEQIIMFKIDNKIIKIIMINTIIKIDIEIIEIIKIVKFFLNIKLINIIIHKIIHNAIIIYNK